MGKQTLQRAVALRRRDARRLLALECVQTVIGVGMLVGVAIRSTLAWSRAATSSLPAGIAIVPLVAVGAAVLMMALAFRVRMGREAVLADLARIELERRATERRDVIPADAHPYRASPCCACPRR